MCYDNNDNNNSNRCIHGICIYVCKKRARPVHAVIGEGTIEIQDFYDNLNSDCMLRDSLSINQRSSSWSSNKDATRQLRCDKCLKVGVWGGVLCGPSTAVVLLAYYRNGNRESGRVLG